MVTADNTTENHGFQLWQQLPESEEEWQHRDDFNALEWKVWKTDLASNLSNYTPHNDAKYLASDTGEVYVGDGAEWDSLGFIYSDAAARAAVVGEVDVSELDGSAGTSGQIPETDGTNVSWVDPPSGGDGSGDVDWQDDGTLIDTTAVANFRNNLDVSQGGSGEVIIDSPDTDEFDAFDDGTQIGSFSEIDAGQNLSGSVGSGRLTLDADSGSGGASTDVEGIENQPTHVGPMYQGTYHDGDGSTDDDPRFGIYFWAQGGLTINSVVVDSDLSAVSKNQIEIQLTDYDGGTENPTVHDTTTVTLSGGPERVDVGFTIPSDGEYVLARDYGPDTSEVIPLRRIEDVDWGVSAYDEHTYPQIDFLGGTHIGESGDWGASGHYYFFFDLEIGDAYDQVMSPWSTDVDEIYMRPFDPAEEYDNVSPRALWIDTS